jgi:hypothetical protein
MTCQSLTNYALTYSLLPNSICIQILVKAKLYKVCPTIFKNLLAHIIPNVYNMKFCFMWFNNIELMLFTLFSIHLFKVYKV